MGAVFYNNYEVIKTLINFGADVNAKDENGVTVLMFAAKNNSNPEIIRVLLSAGADVFAEDKYSKTAYDHARNELIKKLILNAVK